MLPERRTAARRSSQLRARSSPLQLTLDIGAHCLQDRDACREPRLGNAHGDIANALHRRNERNVPYSVQRNGVVFGATDSLLPIVPSAGFVAEF